MADGKDHVKVVEADAPLTSVDDVGSPRDELAYRLRQQQLTSDFGLIALRGGSAAILQHEATRIAAEGLGIDLCKFVLYRPQEDDLLVVAGVGWDDGVIGQATLSCDSGSPAGYAFRTARPVLSNHVSQESRFRTPELLRKHGVRRAINVPVCDDGRPRGVLEADSREDGAFIEADIAFLEGIGVLLSVALTRIEAAEDLVEAHARERLMIGELHHRVRNIFTVMGSLVTMSRREAARSGDDVVNLILGRLAALSAATDAGLPVAGGEDDPALAMLSAPLAALARRVLSPYGDRIEVTDRTGGDQAGSVTLTGAQQTSVALLLHELATNALKHGALAHEAGRIVLNWTLEGSAADRILTLQWSEDAGAATGPGQGPRTVPGGFGSGMIDRLVAGERGRIEREWAERGLVARITLPLT
ncbi:Blue-light-activated histidine kinase 1 [Jannaschia seosinensis]|uniref:histidine kinase n=1 Tax=Jannaschia seosinensis TaxID=313367 RepID=A0A0M7BG43_9RHOB|nr:GAF domain-containing protein [Jannaschia seosinensis]CUH40306.1 Blue-light-activated histidine kinase 1 [Jannaschia seosinensis]